jgi:rRNA-processing protein FCF1
VTETGRFTGAVLLLDADVLYPIRVCDFILTASALRLLARPVVTEEILREAERNLVANRPELSPHRVARRFQQVRAVTDGHNQATAGPVGFEWIVNMKDRHVLRAAIRWGVDFVVTNDAALRRELSAWIVGPAEPGPLRAAIAADELAAGLVTESPDDVRAVVTAMSERFRNPKRSFDETLASLNRSMPSLAALRRP